MNYEEFTDSLKRKVMEEAGPGAEVTLHKIRKNNGVQMDAMTVLMPGETIGPAVYIRDFFQKYKNGGTIKDLAKILLQTCRTQQMYQTLPAEMLREFDNIRHRIQYRLVNFELNRDFLKDVPYSRVLDLACIYYYDLTCPNLEKGTIVIKNRDLEIWNVSQFEIQRIAEQNTPLLQKPVILPMWKVLDHEEDLFREEDTDVPMYVLSNEEKIFGASCLLYPDVLLPLAEKLQADLFILPSSIHELILTPDRGYLSRTDLEDTVREINRTQVEPYEVLSDHVYYYDRDERRILM